MLRLCAFWISCIWANGLSGQVADTIPFELSSGLLTIPGRINDSAASFILDTGSGITVTTSSFNSKAGITQSNKKIQVRDANNTLTKLSQTKLKEVMVGSATARNMSGISFDMPFMDCQHLQLLGQDFIQSLNWAFDFDNQFVVISKQPFEPGEGMDTWPISYEKNRPFLDLRLNNNVVKCLVDFGYRGYLDISESFPWAKELIQQQERFNKVILYSTLEIGLTSSKAAELNKVVLLDSIHISDTRLPYIPATVSNYRGIKLGLNFFTSFCSKLIINNGKAVMYLQLKPTPTYQLRPLDANFVYNNGQLEVSDKNLSDSSSARLLAIGETVKKVDGKTAAEFGSTCDMLKWRYRYKAPELWVEKWDGTKILVRRQSVTDRIPAATSIISSME